MADLEIGKIVKILPPAGADSEVDLLPVYGILLDIEGGHAAIRTLTGDFRVPLRDVVPDDYVKEEE